MNILILIAIIVFLAIVWMIITYNKIIKLKNNIKEQASQIDVQLKRRYDLIPNIVETVKGYAKYESETFEAVVNARNNATSSQNINEELEADKQVEGALQKLFAIAESYPELKADENFKELQDNLRETENKIAYSRQFYNDSVLKYKNAIETFPTVIIAKLFGFSQEDFFEVNDSEKNNFKVSF